MSEKLRRDIEQFLTALEQIQGELLALFVQKRKALTESKNVELVQLSATESQAAQRLQALLAKRNRLLEQARRQGFKIDSLTGLAAALAGGKPDHLTERLEQARDAAAALRHESWVHWIISHRCYNHYSELLELIAHCGEQAPTYSDRACTTTTGGAILDASI